MQKPLHSVNSSELKPLPSVLDIPDSSLLNAHPTTPHHTQSLGHSIFLKRSRHYYGHQYSRRNSGNLANATTSRGKAASLRDERLSFKLATQFNSQTGHHSGACLFWVVNSAPILPRFYFFWWKVRLRNEFCSLMWCPDLWWYWCIKFYHYQNNALSDEWGICTQLVF